MAAKRAPSYTDYIKTLANARVPGVNVQAVLAAHQKNLEALTDAGKTAFEGVQDITGRLGEIYSRNLEELSTVTKEIATPGSSVEEQALKSARIMKTIYQTALSDIWGLGDMASKTSVKSIGVINKRVAESFDEVEGLFPAKETASEPRAPAG